MDTLPVPSEEELRELARRMSGGHPVHEEIAERDLAIHTAPLPEPEETYAESLAQEEAPPAEENPVETAAEEAEDLAAEDEKDEDEDGHD